MKQYMIRVVKYFIYLVVIYTAILSIAEMTGYLGAQEGSVANILRSERGLVALAAMAALSLLYPRFGYLKRQSKASIKGDKASIIKAFEVNGMRLKSESDSELIFCSATMLHKLRLLFEDEVSVTALSGGGVEMSGNRRVVAYAAYRLEAYLRTPNSTKK